MDDNILFDCFNKKCFYSKNNEKIFLNKCPETGEDLIENSNIYGNILVNKNSDLVYDLNTGTQLEGDSIKNLIEVKEYNSDYLIINNPKSPLIKKLDKQILDEIIILGNTKEVFLLCEKVRKKFENPIILITNLKNEDIEKYRNKNYFEKNKIKLVKTEKEFFFDSIRKEIKINNKIYDENMIFDFKLKGYDNNNINEKGLDLLKNGLTLNIYNKIKPFFKSNNISQNYLKNDINFKIKHNYHTNIWDFYCFNINLHPFLNIYTGSNFNPYFNVFNKKYLLEEYFNKIFLNRPNQFIPQYRFKFNERKLFFTGFLGQHDDIIKESDEEIYFFKNKYLIGYLTFKNDLKNLIIYNSLKNCKIIKYEDFLENQINPNLFEKLKNNYFKKINKINNDNYDNRFSDYEINENLIKIDLENDLKFN